VCGGYSRSQNVDADQEFDKEGTGMRSPDMVRQRGAGGRKLASNQNTVPEDHPNSEDETENAGEQCE